MRWILPFEVWTPVCLRHCNNIKKYQASSKWTLAQAITYHESWHEIYIDQLAFQIWTIIILQLNIFLDSHDQLCLSICGKFHFIFWLILIPCFLSQTLFYPNHIHLILNLHCKLYKPIKLLSYTPELRCLLWIKQYSASLSVFVDISHTSLEISLAQNCSKL